MKATVRELPAVDLPALPELEEFPPPPGRWLVLPLSSVCPVGCWSLLLPLSDARTLVCLRSDHCELSRPPNLLGAVPAFIRSAHHPGKAIRPCALLSLLPLGVHRCALAAVAASSHRACNCLALSAPHRAAAPLQLVPIAREHAKADRVLAWIVLPSAVHRLAGLRLGRHLASGHSRQGGRSSSFRCARPPPLPRRAIQLTRCLASSASPVSASFRRQPGSTAARILRSDVE